MRHPLTFLPALLAVLVAGCGVLRTATEAPGRLVGVFTPGSKPTADLIAQTRNRVMRLGDACALEMWEATKRFDALAGTPEAHEQALTWRIEYADQFWRLATGPSPLDALFDTLVTITVLRGYYEGPGQEGWGEATQPLLASCRELEKDCWAVAAESMDPALLEKTREIIDSWLAQDPTRRTAHVSQLPDFEDLAESQGKAGGLSDFFSIDPLSGLEPAVRQIEQARQLGERTVYYLQRLPRLVAARTELLIQRSLKEPQVAATLADLDSFSAAATSVAASVDRLPADLSAEREAAIEQISAELQRQREGLVRDLEQARGPLTDLLAGTQHTAEAGRAMSDSLTETVRALDAFLARFDEKEAEGAEAAPPAAPAPDAPPARPFDILDYATAAEKIALASHELGETIATLERSLPQVQRILDEAAARGDRTVDHVFARAMQGLVAVLVGGALTVLAVRALSPRTRA